MSAELYIPPDWREAARLADLACGHGALAAALGVGAWEALTLLSDKEGWVNRPQMEGALARSGRLWRRLRPQERFGATAGGVIMVQWLGSWMQAGNPFAACAYRHWVACRNVEIVHSESEPCAGMRKRLVQRGSLIWDVNWPEGWMPKAEWVRRIEGELMPERATGWDVIGKWEIEPLETEAMTTTTQLL